MLDQQPLLSDSITILPLTDERWLAFLSRYPSTNIFHHPAWSLLLAECYSYRPFVCAVCDTNGEIMAGLPVMEIESWITGKRWVSLPFTDHCSPLFANRTAIDHLVNGLLDQVLTHGFQKMELRGEIPSYPQLQQISPYVLHTLLLNEDFSINDNRIHQMHRRNAKAALKRGVHIEIGKKSEHLKAFYRLHLETRRNQGVPIQPWRFFDLLEKILLEKDLGFVLLAYHNEKIIAGMVLLGWDQTLTYKYGASCLDSLNLRPNDLLFWTAIQWGCEHGFKVFDFGRTDISNEGLRAFKSRWGATETPLTYSILSKKTAGPTSGSIESLMKLIIKNSPLWVCRSAGELLYRHFG